MNPSYISTNLDDLYNSAPTEIQTLIRDGEVDNTTATLGKIYKLPIGSYVTLSNIISFVLIGALKPEDVVRALVEMLELTQDAAYELAQDMEKSILEKARIKILGKSNKDMVELTFQEGRTPDELRKEILDTTKRESGFVKEQTSAPVAPLPKEAEVPTTAEPQTQPIVSPGSNQKTTEPASGSHSKLMEQLQVLGSIPNDEEVMERLSKIQEQIASMEKKDTSDLETKVPLQQFMFGEKGGETVEPELKSATYSKAPTKYNVDPYREISDES